MSNLIPRGPRLDQIFHEIREMFYQEVDYHHERAFTERFAAALAGDERYRVARTFPEYCSRRVFTAEYLSGVRADASEAQALSQERRNRLGAAFLELYLKELLDLRLMQTDPHLGNYMIEIDPQGENDRLVLLDFGAVREVPADFLAEYAALVDGGARKDERAIERAGRRLNLLQPEDPLDLVREYVELCLMLMEPFDGVYDWGASDLPKRVAAKLARVAFQYRMRSPPRELVFLDRKLGGVFIFLSVLKCRMNARPILERALAEYKARMLA
jgi:predicted unusual protein kinase regulating ubiquinone biosynthesis (AarF/ABC1/UbiB family)